MYNSLQNCDQYLNPSDKLILKSSCANCDATETLVYDWSLDTDQNNTVQSLLWDADSTTGRQSNNIVIKGGVFNSNKQETYTLILSGMV